jgi:hypothetical protein
MERALSMALVVADSRPLVVGALGLVAAAAGAVAILAARGGEREPERPPSDPVGRDSFSGRDTIYGRASSSARSAMRRRLSRVTWLVGIGAGAVTVLIAALLATTAGSTSQGATSSPVEQAPSEAVPEPDELQPPSSLPESAPDGGSSFGFGSGGS